MQQNLNGSWDLQYTVISVSGAIGAATQKSLLIVCVLFEAVEISLVSQAAIMTENTASVY